MARWQIPPLSKERLDELAQTSLRPFSCFMRLILVIFLLWPVTVLFACLMSLTVICGLITLVLRSTLTSSKFRD